MYGDGTTRGTKKFETEKIQGGPLLGSWEGGPWLMSRAMSVFPGGGSFVINLEEAGQKFAPLPESSLPPVLSILSFSMARWFPRGANKGQQGASCLAGPCGIGFSK